MEAPPAPSVAQPTESGNSSSNPSAAAPAAPPAPEQAAPQQQQPNSAAPSATLADARQQQQPTGPTRETILLPIKLDLTYNETRLRETFNWLIDVVKPIPTKMSRDGHMVRDYSSAVDEPTIRAFARRMCEDLDLDLAFDRAVADHIKQQIIRFYDDYVKEWSATDPDIQAFEQHAIATMSPQSVAHGGEMGDDQFRSSRLRDRSRRRGPDDRDPRADLFDRDGINEVWEDLPSESLLAAAANLYGTSDENPLDKIDDEAAIAHAASEEGAEGAPKKVIPKDGLEQRVLLKVRPPDLR
jgi:hypothetical protein